MHSDAALSSRMSAFKAANPGAVLEDFVRCDDGVEHTQYPRRASVQAPFAPVIITTPVLASCGPISGASSHKHPSARQRGLHTDGTPLQLLLAQIPPPSSHRWHSPQLVRTRTTARTSVHTPTKSSRWPEPLPGGPSHLDPMDPKGAPSPPLDPADLLSDAPPSALSSPPSVPPRSDPSTPSEATRPDIPAVKQTSDLSDLDLDPKGSEPDPWNRTLWDMAAAAPAWEQKPLQVWTV